MSLLTSLTDLPPVQALSTFSNLVQQLRTSPSPDKPNTGAPNQPTYDVMLLHLLEQVTKEATDIKGPKIGEGEEDKMVARLEERLRHHNGLLDARTKECEAELEKEEKESKMKITSEGIHDGFDSGVSQDTGSFLSLFFSSGLTFDLLKSRSTSTLLLPTPWRRPRNLSSRKPPRRPQPSKFSTPKPRFVPPPSSPSQLIFSTFPS